MDVDIRPAGGERDLSALERLYFLYLYDLSAYTAHYSLGRDAQWQPSYLADWLERPVCHSLLARREGCAAGFALVAERPFPHMSPEADLRLAEFFVARPYRRDGLGTKLARATFERFHGRWQVNVLAANSGAVNFWRGVVTGADEVATEEEVTFWLET